MRLNPKPLLFVMVFLLCILFLAGYGQESGNDDIVAKSLAEKINRYYQQKTCLSYSFEKREFLKNQDSWMISHGDVKVYVENDSLFFRVTHQYDSVKGAPYPKYFDAVNNRKQYGTNQNKYNYFKDYSSLFNAQKYYTLSGWTNTILTPDDHIGILCRDKGYVPSVRVKKDVYELELRDTAKTSDKNNWWYIFYISKKDFRVLKQVSRSFKSFNDSTICSYNYYDEKPEVIKNYVNGFVPFNGGGPQGARPYLDTIAFIPEFSLPDLSGKIPEISTSYVLINFWYDECKPCIENLEYLEKLQFKKLTVLSVNVRDTLTEQRLKDLSKYHFSIIYGGLNLADQLNIQGYPKTYVYDRQRRILFRHTDYSNSPALQSFLEKLTADY